MHDFIDFENEVTIDFDKLEVKYLISLFNGSSLVIGQNSNKNYYISFDTENSFKTCYEVEITFYNEFFQNVFIQTVIEL